jgi:exodeoxyribonuclease-5
VRWYRPVGDPRRLLRLARHGDARQRECVLPRAPRPRPAPVNHRPLRAGSPGADRARAAGHEQEIAEIRAKLPALDPALRLFEESRLRSLEIRLDDIHKPRFVFNEQSIVRDAALLVLDEVSMVGDDMARDLLAFGKPILVLGDPGQLPPIKGEGAFTKAAPDVMLTEIHRQAGESAIIRLATMARQGLPIPYGEHDPHVWKMPRSSVAPEQMLRGGQVICGRNATRIQLNIVMKRTAGFDTIYPTGERRHGQIEKIICLKNRHDLGIVNGMFLELSDVRDENEIGFSASIRTEDGDPVGATDSKAPRYIIYKGHFDDHVQRDPERAARPLGQEGPDRGGVGLRHHLP